MKCLATHIALVIVFGMAACQSQQTIGQLDTYGLGSDLDSDTLGDNPVSPQGCVYRYRIVDLGTMNASYSSAHGVNNHGEVVGHVTDENGSPRAFLWKPTSDNGTEGTMFDLGEDSLYPETRAEAINDAGEVVGWGFEVDAFSTKTNRALFWSADGEEYSVASGYKATNVAISNNGLVGGNRWPLPSAGLDYASGFTWNSAALFEEDTSSEEPFVDIHELGRLPGASGWPGTSLEDINDAGVAVGSGYSALNLSRPFKWTQETNFTYLGTLSSTIDDGSIPYAINNNGTIVGSSLLIVDEDVRLEHPVLWHPFFDASEPPWTWESCPLPRSSTRAGPSTSTITG